MEHGFTPSACKDQAGRAAETVDVRNGTILLAFGNERQIRSLLRRGSMRNGLIGLAILGTVAIGTPGVAVAQGCPPGQIMHAGICQSATMPGAAAAAPAAPATAATTTAAAP